MVRSLFPRFLLLVAALAACGGDPVTPPPPPPGPVVTTVEVAPGTASLAAPDTIRLTATVKDQNGNAMTGRTVAWSSSSTGVATVASDGLVTAVAQGQATITASVESRSGTAQITVLTPVGRIAIDQDTTLLDIGGSAQRAVTVTDAQGNPLTGRSVTWTSTAPEIATVSAAGLVTAVKPGLTRLIAASGGKADTGAVVVKVPPFTLTLASSGAVTKLVGTGGDTLRATGPDGTKYTFVVPPLALMDTVTITMTPIASATGGPLSGGLVGGVDFRPSGLTFADPGTLRIETTKTPPAGQRLVGVRYEGAGTDLSLAPARDSADVVTMHVPHFSGAAAGFGTTADVEALWAVEAASARRTAAFYATQLAFASVDSPRDGAFELQILEDWFDDIVLPAVRGATTDALLLQARGLWLDIFATAEIYEFEHISDGNFDAPSLVERDNQWFDLFLLKAQQAIEGNMALCSSLKFIPSRLQALANGAYWFDIANHTVEGAFDRAWLDTKSCARIEAVGQERFPEPLENRANLLEMSFRLVFKGDNTVHPTDFVIDSLSVSGASHSLPHRTALTPAGFWSGPVTPGGTGEAVTVFFKACWAIPSGRDFASLPTEFCRLFFISRTAKGAFEVKFFIGAATHDEPADFARCLLKQVQTTGRFVDWTLQSTCYEGLAKTTLASNLTKTTSTHEVRGGSQNTTSSAQIDLEDRILIDAPELTGQPGAIRVQVELSGLIALVGECVPDLPGPGAQIRFTMGPRLGFDNYINVQFSKDSCSETGSLPPIALSRDITFRYGESFPLGFTFAVSAGRGRMPFEYNASATFGYRWLGMTGLPANATVKSATGIDWSKAATPDDPRLPD